MYFYKLKVNLFGKNQTMFVEDFNVIDPEDYFSSENILFWGHKNDKTFEIDIYKEK